MSRYEDLCAAFARARRDYLDYVRDSSEFATVLVDGLISYLEVPPIEVRYIPLTEEAKPNKNYTLFEAMHLADEGFWKVGIVLLVYENPDPNIISPHETVLLPLLMKKVEEHFVVKLGSEGEEFNIHRDKPEEFEAFYEHVFHKIKESYEEGLQRYLEGGEGMERKIGFF